MEAASVETIQTVGLQAALLSCLTSPRAFWTPAVRRPAQQVAPLVLPPQQVPLAGGASILLHLRPPRRPILCRTNALCTADITLPNLLTYTLRNSAVKRATRTGLNQKLPVTRTTGGGHNPPGKDLDPAPEADFS